MTAIKMMEVMLEKKMPMSELAAPYKAYPQVLKNVRVADKAAVRTDEEIQQCIREIEALLGEDGRILVRESGTEPIIRVMVEAKDLETCQKYVDQVAGLIAKKIADI